LRFSRDRALEKPTTIHDDSPHSGPGGDRLFCLFVYLSICLFLYFSPKDKKFNRVGTVDTPPRWPEWTLRVGMQRECGVRYRSAERLSRKIRCRYRLAP
jgi:hypothetical protein